MTGQLVLLRHGQSTANAAGTFTGLRDVALTERGVAEATRAGSLLLRAGFSPDLVLTSALERAFHTAELVTEVLASDVPIESTWRLNERNYGALTGMSKQNAQAALGAEQFFAVRRTRTGRPPRMSIRAWLALRRTPALRGLPWAAARRTETLSDVIRRVQPVLSDRITPALRDGQTVLVVAHGNSLRALCACIDGLTDGELADLNLPTGEPLIYQFDGDGGFCPRGGEYLHPAARAAAAAVAAEGGT
ncbi:2,3-diphosphoglycerate-dependent phosphoglycerate mutase [Curtobacterium sp. KBS0715]|uniref:2,3-bisphosphoglycerate-dependent phosphoglycerate mutase n=1 Tax=Curtobacterium sp. KBS0715 TaxID=1179671 RepID=UPI00110DD0ED|nr:2,3-diphosphoglycerate-dependent phosphoglycerate mutase [Curtobacterium sp. KBS0715]TSD11620.1 2,3-diphosphoglycerate-dependent phosphoglycerate mutase [Curtobacterium sp. KBS0715]